MAEDTQCWEEGRGSKGCDRRREDEEMDKGVRKRGKAATATGGI